MTAQDASGTLTINGVSINVETTSDATSTRSAVATAINAVADETGVMAVDSETDELGVTLVADDGRNITLDYSGTLTAQNTGLAETSAGVKAQVSASNASVSPSSALDFSSAQGASVTFGLDITQSGLSELNFSDSPDGNGATSFVVETDQGSFDVMLNQDYSGADTDSQNYLNMVDDINDQIVDSGFTAGVNSDGKLAFTQDVEGKGYIKLSNGSEGGNGAQTTATLTAGASTIEDVNLADPATALGFDVTDVNGRSATVDINGDGGQADIATLVTDINTDLAAGGVSVRARENTDTGALEFFATKSPTDTTEAAGNNDFTLSNFTDGGNTNAVNNAAFGFAEDFDWGDSTSTISTNNAASATAAGVTAVDGSAGSAGTAATLTTGVATGNLNALAALSLSLIHI